MLPPVVREFFAGNFAEISSLIKCGGQKNSFMLIKQYNIRKCYRRFFMKFEISTMGSMLHFKIYNDKLITEQSIFQFVLRRISLLISYYM